MQTLSNKTFAKGFVAGVKHPLLEKFFYRTWDQALEKIAEFIKESRATILKRSFHLKLNMREYRKLTVFKEKTGKSRTRIIRELINSLPDDL